MVNSNRRLVLGQFADCVTADPHVDDYSFSRRLQRGPYEPLFLLVKEPTKEGKNKIGVRPWLAEGYEMLDGGSVFVVKLRKGIKFTDGTPFNAKAVKYNLERIMALNYTPADDLEYVKDVEVAGEHTIKIKLKYYFPLFIQHLSYPLMVSPTAAKEHEVEGDWGKGWLATHAVGTGPYLLDEWVKGEYWRLVKNDAYWGGWEGKHVDEVVGLIVPNEFDRVEMLRQGKIDLTRVNDPSALQDLRNRPDTKVYEIRDTGAYMTVQMKNRGYLADPRIRKAFLHVFPYEEFWTKLVPGHGRVTNGPMSDTLFGWNSELPVLHQDLEKARQLLAEAGYPNGLPEPLTLYIFTPFLPWWADMALVLQESLAQIGIELNIVDFTDVNEYLSAVLNPDKLAGPDLYVWGTGARTESPARYLGLWIFANIPPGRNGAFYENPRYDSLYEKALAAASDTERARFYREMQELLVEDPPAIYIGEYFYYWGLRREVQNLTSVLAEDRITGGWYYIYKEL